VEGGSRYLAQQLKEFGQPELALAAYNWGPRNIENAVAKLRAEKKDVTWENVLSVVKVPRETREYVNKVMRLV
jgi:soluble lytic murein transglycosylase-like protein